MAEPLKNSFGRDVPVMLASMISAVEPAFDADAFVVAALAGYDDLELTPRARQIAAALAVHLPEDVERALDVIVASLGPEIEDAELSGMEVFRYLPFVFYVADHGLDHFEAAMRAQYELTKRFTAEFSIRAYLDHHPDETLATLRRWAADPNVHVRRLVSEGTRPRLPWAPRLRRFIDDPAPVLELLEVLKDDAEIYVRRSVANNLNDIAKDHPDLVVETCGRWAVGASAERRWLIRHGLRTLVKQGHRGALAVLGFGSGSPVRVSVAVASGVVQIGAKQAVTISVENPDAVPHTVAVDFRVHFVKANGSLSPKVFKGAELVVAPGETVDFRRTVSLVQHTTRTHYPGEHLVDVMVNGEVRPGAGFLVV